MVAAGAKVVRMDCRGLDASYDDLVARAHAHGLGVLVVLPDLVHVQTLAGAAAQKYGATVDYELGNEWNLRGVPPAQWMQANNTAYAQIKVAASAAKVISGALAPWAKYGQASDGMHWTPLDYLEQALKAAPLKCDVVGWHPYFYGQGWTAAQCLDVTSVYSGLAEIAWTTPSVQTLLPGRRVAATEYGVPTIYVADQANYVSGFLKTWTAQQWADDAYFYSGRDEQGISPTEDSFGLYDFAWQPKPALAAYKAAS